MNTELIATFIENRFSFLLQKGYSPPQINIQPREISLVYRPTYPKQALLSIIYDGYGLPYVQITPLWLKNTRGTTRTFALIEAIKVINPCTFQQLNNYSRQKNAPSQLDYCLIFMIDFLRTYFSIIICPDISFVEKIEHNR